LTWSKGIGALMGLLEGKEVFNLPMISYEFHIYLEQRKNILPVGRNQ
jgi:hypothetical protein